MYHLLRQHPDVFMSPVKEPFYFAQDLDFPRGWVMVKEQGQYLNLFSGARGEARSGEASPFYLYSDHAAQEIKRRCPDPRVIIMLRNPPDMMYSLYCLWRFSGLDPSPTFEVALDNESPGIPLVRRYRALAHYPDHVTRYLTHLGRSHVHVVVFDDLVANPENTYRDVCAFLDIDSTFRPALSLSDRQRGASRAPRLRWVPRALSAYGARWGRPRRWWPGLHGAILRVNAVSSLKDAPKFL